MSLTRKQFLSSGAAALAPAVHGQSQSSKRPKNVLLLLSDQHKPDALGIYGDKIARTPSLDTFARTAMRFDQTYCTNPICTPSRASLLTGLYTNKHRTWSNTTPWPIEIPTVAHHFSKAGYVSGLIGKMHFVDAQTHGFDYRLDFNDWYQYLGPKTKLYAEELSRANSGSGMPQIDDLWRDFGDPWKDVRELDDRKGAVHVGRASKIAERDHFESFVARESVRFLKRFSGDHPFFLISSFLKPHDPFMPPVEYANMFHAPDMTLPETYGKVDMKRVPEEIRRRISNDAPNPDIHDPALARQRMAMYYGNVAHMDTCVGRVLDTLRELGLEKDTIVIYTADHGEMLGEHGLWGKFVFYEPSVGVPMFVRVPGMTREGSASQAPVSLVSLIPTLLDLCGIAVPAGLDGAPLTPYLHEPGRAAASPVYSEFALRTKNARSMIRKGDWKYSYYTNDTPELYNLKDDPKEMRNLAAEPAHRTRAKDLESELRAWNQPLQS